MAEPDRLDAVEAARTGPVLPTGLRGVDRPRASADGLTAPPGEPARQQARSVRY